MMRFYVSIFFLFFLNVLVFDTALAEVKIGLEREQKSRLSTATHFGYSVENSSTTGFKNVGGSILFLDISQPFTEDFELGLRTIGSGGQENNGQFYRLGAGPMILYRVVSQWYIQFGLLYFSEHATTTDGLREYRSRGQSVMVGWQRSFAISEHLEAGWGGFVSRHRGSMEAVSSLPISGESRFSSVDKNVGGSQGLTGSLKISF